MIRPELFSTNKIRNKLQIQFDKGYDLGSTDWTVINIFKNHLMRTIVTYQMATWIRNLKIFRGMKAYRAA